MARTEHEHDEYGEHDKHDEDSWESAKTMQRASYESLLLKQADFEYPSDPYDSYEPMSNEEFEELIEKAYGPDREAGSRHEAADETGSGNSYGSLALPLRPRGLICGKEINTFSNQVPTPSSPWHEEKRLKHNILNEKNGGDSGAIDLNATQTTNAVAKPLVSGNSYGSATNEPNAHHHAKL